MLIKDMPRHKGRFHIEQDLGWEVEQNPLTKKMSRTKPVLLDTWTLYERVDGPDGEIGSAFNTTPRLIGVSRVKAFSALRRTHVK